MDKEEKSKEQKRRNSFRKKKKIKCITNGKVYNDINEICEDLNLTNKRCIWRVASGKRPRHKNYKFTYVTSE